MSNRQTYFLDLPTLLAHLSSQSCELTTELKISKKVARGSILLKEGKIVHCLLSFQDGFQITGEQAYKQLEAATQWQVELEVLQEKKSPSPLTPFAPQLSPSALPYDSLPSPPLRQKKPLDVAFLQNLSAQQRFIVHSVFATVNGKRSREEIKAQLRLSPRDIDDALNWLRALDVIE
jgi:hypothetical protein